MKSDEEPEIRPACGYRELDEALAVRRAVFVEEQLGPPEDEPDPWDAAARHFVVVAEGRIVGTARLYSPAPETAKIGRVALLPAYRGRGWGARLVRELLAQAAALGFRQVVLDAQADAVPFYERFGFAPEGEVFMEAGIPHQRMVLAVRST